MLFSKGTQKPPPGAKVNPRHPFSRGLVFAMLFDQARPLVAGGSYIDMVRSGGAPTLYASFENTMPAWTSNLEGSALSFTVPDSRFTLAPINSSHIWLPSAACTVAFIRRRTNATFNTKVMANSSANMVIYAPFIDGTVYWDYGGSGGANRLSLGGLSFQTIIPERWVFTAGPQGSNFWRNGVKLASQSTAISRTADNSTVTFNVTDYNEFNFIQMNNVQWSDAMCRWWSAEPYAHLYQSSLKRGYPIISSGYAYSQIII